MTPTQYQTYLDSFNDKNYDRVLEFWAPSFKVWVQGELLFDSPDSLKKVYGFLHDHVKEEIEVKHYLSDSDRIFMEANVRITALKIITAEALADNDINGIMPIDAGVVMDIPQFIHYHLDGGKFKTASCLVSGPPVIGQDPA